MAVGMHATEMPAAPADQSQGDLDHPFKKPKGRWGVSQRIKRKDRRRAHAAGYKKAFN